MLVATPSTSHDDALAAVVDRLQRDRASIDVLVHCAGVHAMGAIEHAPVADLDRQYRTNVRAPYLLTQRLLPALRRSNGQVVFINSSVGLDAGAQVGPYASTKTRCERSLTACATRSTPTACASSVYLGPHREPDAAEIHAAEGKPYRPTDLLQPDDVAAMVVAALSLPSTAEVTELRIRPMRK